MIQIPILDIDAWCLFRLIRTIRIIRYFAFMFKKPFLLLIKVYQAIFSLDHGPLAKFFPSGFCRYQPSCSQYTYQAINKYGIIKGSLLGAWRILRCNPWSKGGWDPVK